MKNTKNKNVTISISEETRSKATEVSEKLFGSDKFSTMIAYLINDKHEKICKQ